MKTKVYFALKKIANTKSTSLWNSFLRKETWYINIRWVIERFLLSHPLFGSVWITHSQTICFTYLPFETKRKRDKSTRTLYRTVFELFTQFEVGKHLTNQTHLSKIFYEPCQWDTFVKRNTDIFYLMRFSTQCYFAGAKITDILSVFFFLTI